MRKTVTCFILALAGFLRADGNREAARFGLAPGAPAATNAAALQRAVDGGRCTVEILEPGVYNLDRTIWLDSDTRLRFGPGVTLRKAVPYAGVFSNRGLPTRNWNTNIWIEGLTLDVNGSAGVYPPESPAHGMRGQLAFYCIRHLTIRDLCIPNLANVLYGVHVAQFENFTLDGFEVRGRKDGIHINSGRRFAIRNGVVETSDDGIALLASDWYGSGPIVGDLEDGLVENVTDENTHGYADCNFARILTAAWPDWHRGIRLQRGDTVRVGQNIWRLQGPLGTNEFVSLEAPVAPTHGMQWIDSAGLTFWLMKRDGSRQANIRNVTFRNLYLRAPRNGFLADWETHSEWNRSIHPEVRPEAYPVCEISLENIYSGSPLALISGNESVAVRMRNITKPHGPLLNINGHRDAPVKVQAHLDGVRLQPRETNEPDISVGGLGSSLDLTLNALMQERDLRLAIGKGVKARANGIGSIDRVDGLSPRTGDSVKVQGELQTFDGSRWIK